MDDRQSNSILEHSQAEDGGSVYNDSWDNRNNKSFLNDAQLFDGRLQNTLNDILSLPEITIPFDDGMRKFCEEIEDLNDEELFERISEITKIYSYPFDLRAYWLIDTIAGFLLSGKKKGLMSDKLWATLAWFLFIFIGFGDNKWTHESLMQHIQSVILKSTEEVKMRDLPKSSLFDESPLQPIPQRRESILTIQSKQKRASRRMSNISSIDTLTQYSKGNKKVKRLKKVSIQKSEVLYTLEDLLIIVDIFYDLFSSGFQFKLMQWSFYDLDQFIILEFPFPINIPRNLNQPPVIPEPVPDQINVKGKNKKSKEKKTAKSEDGKTKEPESQKRDEKSASKGKKSKKNKNAQTTEEDKEKDQGELLPDNEEPKPEEPTQNWEVDDNVYILPLQDAIGIDEDFFGQIFPKTEEKSAGNKGKKGKKEGKKEGKKKGK